MPKWDVNSYEGTEVPEVIESPLERERIRVFSQHVCKKEESFFSELESAILKTAKLPEEIERKDEIIDKYLCDYRHYSEVKRFRGSEYIVVLERAENGLRNNIVDI